MGGGTEEATAPPGIEGGVLVSAFDYSADNFFAAMEEIAALCGASGEDEGFEATEVQRFSPIITFLKEWRYFCYEPIIINFAHETESKETIDVAKGISLPQFSSAAVPKMEQFPDRTILLESNDFVLHAGGPVWALDWCPRVPEKSNNIMCEYLAVSAHPPGSAYHKIGVPLIGRGVIQIWCLMNMDEKAEFLPPWPKGGGKSMKKPLRKEQMNNLSSGKMVSTAVRPRGRPRKRPLEKEPLCASDAEDEFYLPRPRGRSEKKPDLCVEVPKHMQEPSLAKPRGRPRKRPNLGLNVLEASSFASPVGIPGKQPLPDLTNLNGKKESPPHSISLTPHRMLALSADLGSLALSLPAAAELTGKEESCVPRRRGRPRKNPIPNVNDCAPASGVELGEDASILPTSGSANANIKGQGVDLDEVALALPSSTDLNGKEESPVPSCRVRPRKVPILSGNECAPASGYELQEGASVLATSRVESSSLNDSSIYLMDIPLALHASADIRGKEESSVSRFRERPRKKPIPDVNECISATASVCKIREDTSALATSRGVECSSLNGLSIDLMEIPLALLASADLRGKEELSVPRCRGRPRKKPIPNVKESVPSPAPYCELWEDASALATSRRAENSSLNDLSIDLEDKPLALLASTDLRCTEESSVSRRSGRSIKKPLRYVKECVPAPASGCELREDASALATSRGVESSSLNGLSVDLMCNPLALLPPSDLKCKEESSVPRRTGRPRKKPIRYAKECVPAPASGCELWEDASALATSRGVESSSLNGLSIDLVDIPLALHVSADLGGKEELECVPTPASGCELREDASALATSSGVESSSLNGLSADLICNPLALLAPANLKCKEESFVPRSRGKPRKKPIRYVKECVPAPASGCELWENASALATSRGVESSSLNGSNIDLVDIPLALHVSADLGGKVESSVPRCRRRPRKKPIPNVKDCVPAPGVELGGDASGMPTSRGLKNSTSNCSNVDLVEVPLGFLVPADLKAKEELFVPRCSGRQEKKPFPILNECVQASGIELREDISALPISRGLENSSLNALTVNLQEVPLALPASADSNCKDESLVPSCRGRPRKKPIPNLSESVLASSVEFREDVSVLPNSRGFEKTTTTNHVSVDSEEVALVLPVSTDLKGTEELSVHRCRGRRKKEPTPNANECIRASGTELGEDASAILNHGKQSSVTVEPTHGNHCQDEMVVSKETRSSNANTTNSVIPKVIALPRVVLCLAHNGKVAWDVKWRPSNGNTSEGKHHMGYLAVLLGNGSLEVWEVPLPSIVKILYASSCNEGTDPRFLKLDPVFRCSKVKCGDRQSIPLTVEWSPSGLSDLILAGCHDGTVAMWKFSAHNSSLDTKPLLCFTADSVPIRALAWAPEESDAESTNLIATAGHDGLKFWDIRDPYRPLWDFNPVQRVILSLDWSKDPRSIILSFDDGTLRTISLWKTANDVPVTGKSFIGTKQQGMHVYQCSSSAIWSVQVSRNTGLVSYCSADGCALCFQLTAESVDKGSTRYRQPHFLCGSLGEENKALKISTPSPNAPQRDISFSLKKSLSYMGDAPRTISTYLSERVNSQMAALCSADNRSMFLGSGGSQTPPAGKTPSKSRSSRRKKPKSDASAATGQALVPVEANRKTLQSSENQDGDPKGKIEVLPAKVVAMHRVRWNMNRGSERWLCYGGAAGIVRCQKIELPTMPIRSIKPVNLRHHA